MENLVSNKKILIVTEFFYPEEFKVNDIALIWKREGYDVDVLTLTPTYPLGKVFKGYKNKLFMKDSYKGVNIYRIYAVTGYKNSIVKKILKYINFMVFGSIVSIFIGKRYDYIFGCNLGSLTSMLPAVIIRKLYKKPLMFWVQDLWPDSVYAYGFKKTKVLSALLNIFVKFMYHNITSIAISGKGFESRLKPYVKSNMKFIYSPNWADDLNLDVEPAILSNTMNIHFTFAGNIGKVQNLENIINAFCLLPNNYQKKAQLNIIGDGSNLQHLKLIANRSSNIIFHGKKNREDMAKYYNASDFLIVSLIDKPIFSVTVPAKTQTYIAAKKPILGIINGETAEIIKSNNLGICVEPGNIYLIKEAFLDCIDMPINIRESFIRNSEKLLNNTFNKNYVLSGITNALIE